MRRTSIDAAAQQVGVRRASAAGKRATSVVDQMVRHEIGDAIEPERRQLRQHAALVGNAGAEHVVERRDAIGRDDQQVRVVDRVDVAHLASANERQIRER